MFASLLLASTLLSSQAQGAAVPAAPACETVQACIEILRADAGNRRQVREPVSRRLAELGAPAVDALVPLLMDPNLQIRESAGLALTYFTQIDPRHFPALVHAWRRGDTVNRPGRGNGWLPRPVAATGTDEALRLLWEDLERNPEGGSNSQTFFALATGFGDRIRPLLLARFAACRDEVSFEPGAYRGPCAGLYDLLREFRPPFPAWSIPPILGLAEHARSDAVRAQAETTLAGLHHPAALAPLQRRLAALPGRPRTDDTRWEVGGLIGQIERYGSAARASGPAIIPYLDAAYDPGLRADAALALGRIDARPGIPALLAMAPDLTDDWLLAYNVAESQGRLRATEARPLLERLANDYWHRGVRRNAARALHAIAGGPFATTPNATADDPAYPAPRGPDGEEYVYMGDLRFLDDDAARTCHDQTVRDLVTTDAATRARLRRRIPVAFAQGEVVFALPVRRGTLVGIDGGEFGGGLVMLPDRGAPRKLFGSPVSFAWQAGSRLYVAAGVAHLSLDTGTLFIVDPARLTVERSIRLPASPRAFYAARGGARVIGTAAGQVAIRPDGQLVDVERLEGCMGG